MFQFLKDLAFVVGSIILAVSGVFFLIFCFIAAIVGGFTVIGIVGFLLFALALLGAAHKLNSLED